MNDIELKLQELYGKYTKLDNGTYFVRTKNGDEIYIPESISQNQSMIAYAPGSGGFAGASQRFKDLYNDPNPPSYLTVVSQTSFDYNNILNIGTDTINSLGGNVDNIVYASFSLSGITGLNKSEKYLKENPNVSMSIISCDGCETYNNLLDSYPTIKETQTPFIMLANGFKYKYTYLKTVENGYNSYFLNISNESRGGHSQLNKDMINYLLPYAIGDLNEMKENDIGYKLYKGSNLEEVVDLENIKPNGTVNYEGYEKNKYKNELKLNNLIFDNLDKFNDNDIVGDGYVKANFKYAQAALNNIRKSISTANIATKTPTLPISGAAGLLSSITACINQYSTMTVSLYSKLAQETQATGSYVQSIINTDLNLKNDVETINSNTNTTTITNNTSTIVNTTTTLKSVTDLNNTSKINETNNICKTNTTTKITTETNTNNSTSTMNNTNNSTSTVTNTNNYNSSNSSTSPNKTNIYDTIKNNKLTWNYPDGHNLTLTIENGIITNMKFTYNYSSYDELNKNINNILAGQIDRQYFDKMTIIDKAVEVTIKPNYFKELSLTKIKEMFFK